MEKDRERRYGSALALAEDLQRFLDGEPVHARPRTFGYRVSAWGRRHRAIAMAAMVAVLAVAAASAYGLAVNRRAAARARLAPALRPAGGTPGRPDPLCPPAVGTRHPAGDGAGGQGHGRPARGHGTGRFRRPSPRAPRPGPRFPRPRPPRGSLDRFRRSLAAGERSPDLQTDLGLALGILYARGLKEEQGLRLPALRSQRLARLRREFKEPALEHLRQGRIGAGPEGAYAEALMAAFEGRAAEGLSRTSATLAQAPWFYEALLLEIKLGLTESIHRNPLEAAEQSRDLGHLDALGRTTERLLKLAPSLPEAYFLESDRWYERGRILEGSDAVGSSAAYRAGLGWAERGLTIDARHADLLIARTRHLWVLSKRPSAPARIRGMPSPKPAGRRTWPPRWNPAAATSSGSRAGDVLAAQASWLSSIGKDPDGGGRRRPCQPRAGPGPRRPRPVRPAQPGLAPGVPCRRPAQPEAGSPPGLSGRRGSV